MYTSSKYIYRYFPEIISATKPFCGAAGIIAPTPPLGSPSTWAPF